MTSSSFSASVLNRSSMPPPNVTLSTAKTPPSKARKIFNSVKKFITKSSVCAPYGYSDNAGVGIGQSMMFPAADTIRSYDDASCNSLSPIAKTARKAGAVFLFLISTPLTLLGAAVKAISTSFPLKIGELTSDSIQRTSPKKVDQIYELLKIFHEMATRHELNYWAESGTLLGQIRHAGVIPWDDDADVGIWKEDKEKLKNLKKDFADKGIDFVNYESVGRDMFQLRFNAKTLRDTYQVGPKETGHLDIFFYAEQADDNIHYTDNWMRSEYPKGHFLKESLTNITERPFGPPSKGLKIRIPGNPEEYVKRLYGKSCLDFGILTHSHISLFGLGLPIPNLSKAKYKIIKGNFATGNSWK
jgi:hypothetical protein